MLRQCIEMGSVSQRHGQPIRQQSLLRPRQAFEGSWPSNVFFVLQHEAWLSDWMGEGVLIRPTFVWSTIFWLVWRLMDVFYGL